MAIRDNVEETEKKVLNLKNDIEGIINSFADEHIQAGLSNALIDGKDLLNEVEDALDFVKERLDRMEAEK